MVAALQTAYHAAMSMSFGNLQNLFAEGNEIFCLQIQGSDRVFGMRVETGAEQDQLRPNLFSRLLQRLLETGVIFLSGCAVSNGRIDDVPQSLSSPALIFRSGSGIEAVAIPMNAEKLDLGTLVKDVLRSVTVVHVKIDDQNLAQVMSCSGMVSRQSNVIE